MSSQVRRMAEQDIEAAAANGVEAFGGDPRYWAGWMREGPWRSGWVVEHAGEVAASALALPRTWHYAGVAYSVAAISGVVVRPTERRRGLAGTLMRAILEDALAQGLPFSLLYPFQSGYYRRLGYATVGLTQFYRIPLRQLPDDPALRLHVRPLREADREAVYDLHRRSLWGGAGGLERSAAHWARRWSSAAERWVVYDDGEVQGYLVYERIENQLHLQELIALSAEAERGLWSFVAAQAEEAVAATYHAPADRPLWPMLREPRMHEGVDHGNDRVDTSMLTTGLMARLVALPAALNARRYDPAARGQLTLAVEDPVLSANTTRLHLSFDAGRATVEPTTVAPDAACDIVTLTQLCCGVLRASDARWYGRLSAADEPVALLDRALASPPPFLHAADHF